MNRLLCLFALAWPLAAAASEYYLESPAVGTRSDANHIERQCDSLGFKCRTLRRFHHGLGWEFVVLAEGFDDLEKARGAAGQIAHAIGHGVQVFAIEGAEATVLGTAEPTVEEPVPAGGSEIDEDPAAPGVADLLARVARAHGGEHGGSALLASVDSLVFRFVRELPDGSAIDHVYARRGDDRYLAVTSESERVASSVAVVAGPAAWLVTDPEGDEVSSFEDAASTTREVDRLSPESTLGLSLGIALAVAERPEFQLAYLEESARSDESAVQFDGDGLFAPLRAVFATGQEQLKSITVRGDAGSVRTEYREYRSVEPGLMVPHELLSYRDGVLVDTVKVVELDLNSPLPDEWFEVPTQ